MELISFLNYRKKSKVSRAKNGDKDAFVELINENRLDIYRVAKGILKDDYDIEDAIQNTVIKAFENITTLKKDEFFKTWIIRILINECRTILRKNKKVVSFEESISQENYCDNYENTDLINAINSLSEELKITTTLYYFEDMSTKDIAEILGVPLGTVRSRLARAREKLREIMEEV